MKGTRGLPLLLAVALCVPGAAANARAEAAPKDKAAAPKAGAPAKGIVEDKAVEVLKAMSARLASAKTMTFKAVATYESPSRYGAPLAYTTSSTVTVRRPDGLKVLTAADGPPAEFWFDGKTMNAYAPEEKLLASAPAPGTIDAMLKAVYDAAGTYFPFTDVIVADPWADIARSLTLAFYIGQSKVVGGVTTDMVAYESEGVFVQIWIGADDKLPRMARAVYFDDRLRLRHQVELSDWKLDAKLDADAFTLKPPADAARVAFTHPKTRQAPAPAKSGKGAPAKAADAPKAK